MKKMRLDKDIVVIISPYLSCPVPTVAVVFNLSCNLLLLIEDIYI